MLFRSQDDKEHRQAEIHRVSAGCRDVQAEPDEGRRKPSPRACADGEGRCRAAARQGLVRRRPHRGDFAPLRDLLVVGTTAVIASRQLFEEWFTIGVSRIKLMAKQTAITVRNDFCI